MRPGTSRTACFFSTVRPGLCCAPRSLLFNDIFPKERPICCVRRSLCRVAPAGQRRCCPQSDASEFFCPVCLLCASQFRLEGFTLISRLVLCSTFETPFDDYKGMGSCDARCGSAGMAVAFAAFC